MAIVLPKFPRRRAPAARDGVEPRPTVALRCCRADARYAPGQPLSCTWQLNRLTADQVQGLEISVLWYTEGKGDEDLSVHYFHRWSAARLSELDLSQPERFETILPASPTSYDGRLFRIRWCVRLRLFLVNGKEILAETPFKVTTSPAITFEPVAPPVDSFPAAPR